MIKRLFNKMILKQYQFLINQIDGSRYTLYAYNFRDALRQHSKHFAYEPISIEPIDNIKGTNAILGSNMFKYDVGFKKEVYALSPNGAVEAFQKSTNLKDLSVEQIYPVWRRA